MTTPGGAFLELAHRGEATAASLARAAEFRSPLAARLYSGADDGEMARLLRRIERAKVADKGELGAPDASGVRHAARAAGLLHLNLSHSLFSLRQIKALAACLSRDRFIGSLALRNNRVDNKGLGALLDALAGGPPAPRPRWRPRCRPPRRAGPAGPSRLRARAEGQRACEGRVGGLEHAADPYRRALGRLGRCLRRVRVLWVVCMQQRRVL